MIGLHQPVTLASDTDQDSRGAAHATATPTPALGFEANKVIGVVCSGDVAVYRDDVKNSIERGLAQRPDAVWVCIEPKSDRMTHDVMLSLDIEPVVLPLVDHWRRKPPKLPTLQWNIASKLSPVALLLVLMRRFDIVRPDVSYDYRRNWRDAELSSLCDELIIFHKRTGSSPWRDRLASGHYKKLWVVELGPEPIKKRGKTRKPVGA